GLRRTLFMHEPDMPKPARRRRWPLVVLIVLLVLCLAGAGYVYLSYNAEEELRTAQAETDARDPGWHLGDIEDHGPAVPDGENSALQVMKVKGLIPAQWASAQDFWDLFQDQPAQAQLNEEQIQALRAELQKAAQALDEAHKLAGMPQGR